MANEVHAPPDTEGMAGLLRGIINDIGDLFSKQIKFARKEIEADLTKSRRAAAILGLGSGIAFLGAILLSLMLVYLLHYVSNPAVESTERFPLWACFGIVSAVFLVIGSGIAYAGCQMFASFNPLPDQTVQTVKENVGWIANANSK
jgi:predicted PurR-regulated permease PerM